MKKTDIVVLLLSTCAVSSGFAGCDCGGGSSGGSCRCNQDPDCPDGFHCEYCMCISDCNDSTDCPPEAPNCDPATGRCTGPCETNADCPDPAFPNCDPQTGICFGPCGGDSDCPPEFPQCDTQSGLCHAPECDTDAECDPPDTVCEDWVCVSGCTRHSDCESGDRCDLRDPGNVYHCEPRDCLTDADCDPPTTVCDSEGLVDPDGGGYCDPGCATYYDCRQLGYDCDPATGTCAPRDYGDIGQDCGVGCASNFCLAGMGNLCTAFCCVQHDCPPGWGCRPYEDGTGAGHTVDVCVTLDATHGMGRHNDPCSEATDCRSGVCGWSPGVCRDTCCSHSDCQQPFLPGQQCRIVGGGYTACMTEDASGLDPVGAMGCATTGSSSDCRSNMCFYYFSTNTGCADNSECPANRPICAEVTGDATNDCVRDMCVDHCCSYEDCPDFGGDIYFCGRWLFGTVGDFDLCLLHEGSATLAEGQTCANGNECRSKFCSESDLVCRKRCCTDADCSDPAYPACGLEQHWVHNRQRWVNVCLP